MNTEPMAYIATHSCGGWVLVTVDLPERAKDNAKEIAQCIRDGYTIERVTVQAVRTTLTMCECNKARRKQAGQQQELTHLKGGGA